MLPAFLLIINFEKFIKGTERNFFLILLMTIICSLIHERASFYIGLYFLFSIFYEKKFLLFKSRENIFFIIIAFSLIFYCFFYLKVFSMSPHAGSYSIGQFRINIINIFIFQWKTYTACAFVMNYWKFVLLFLKYLIKTFVGCSTNWYIFLYIPICKCLRI